MDQYQDYRDGNIGRLLAVETEYHADKRQRAVHLSQQWGTFSPLSIWLVHPVDLAVWYLGEVSESSMTVTQSQHFRDLHQGPDNFVAVLQNKQQTIGLVKGFYTSPQPSTVRVTLRVNGATDCQLPRHALQPTQRYHRQPRRLWRPPRVVFLVTTPTTLAKWLIFDEF